MKAFQIHEFKAPAALVDIPISAPLEHEIQLRIQACGLNFADLLMGRGHYQETPQLPFTLGMEVCGVITQLGTGVRQFALGQRVAVFAGHGGLAEYGNFPMDSTREIPDSMSATTAAGFQVAYGTAHLALTQRAKLMAGENVLIFGAAGGVGLTAVEIAKQMGARVIAVARGAAKGAVARAAGADHVLDSESDDIMAEVKKLGGADVVYDPVGGAAFDTAMRVTKPEGRILTIGFASGDIPKIPANILLVKNITVIGFYWGGYLKHNPRALNDSLKTMMDWHSAGRLSPHIGQTFPLAEAQKGLDLLASRKSTGKVVITMEE